MGESWEPEYFIGEELTATFSEIQARKPTPTLRPVNDIAQEIADEFFMPSSSLHQKLRLLVVQAIGKEREVTYYYINQMGRWVAKAKADGKLR